MISYYSMSIHFQFYDFTSKTPCFFSEAPAPEEENVAPPDTLRQVRGTSRYEEVDHFLDDV